MQRYSYSACHSICGDHDAFLALSKVCLNPVALLTEQGCGLDSTLDQEAAYYIASNDFGDLEPTPLADHTGAPALDCQSYIARDHFLEDDRFAPQVTPTPINSSYYVSVDHTTGVTFHAGQPPANLNHHIFDSIRASPQMASSSRPYPNLQRCDSILFSHRGLSPPSSLVKEECTLRDRILKAKRVVSTTMKRRNRHIKEKILPEHFVPGPYTVIIDRRKRARQAPGNQCLRKIAVGFLMEYANASDRTGRSQIVSTIWRMIEDSCPNGGAFVRLGSDDRWYTVRDSVATEKVGYTMRELLGERYRSSSLGKKMVRLQSSGTDYFSP